MTLQRKLKNLNSFSIQLDASLNVKGVSHNLVDLLSGKIIMGEEINVLFDIFFNNEFFYNEKYFDSFMSKVNDVLHNDVLVKDHVNLTNNKPGESVNVSFDIYISLICSEEKTIIINITNYKLIESKIQFYDEIMSDFQDEFSILNNLREIGHFLIDYDVSKNLIYADEYFPKLLGLEKSSDNTYIVTRHAQKSSAHVFTRDDSFFVKTDMLINGEIEYFDDEFNIGDKWVKIEAKVLKKDDVGRCVFLGGVVYDVSQYRSFKDMEYLFTIYELAIRSGGIGIFHYNYDIHERGKFEANSIYASMFGIDPDEDGYYELSDFEKALLPLEEDFSLKGSVISSLNKLLKGEIEGTNDDILKIKNLKTNDIKYLLSSSKIDKRNDDGTPLHFGGIVLDISERIQSEKDKIEFAYRDELTRLSNNRKLFKDLRTYDSGIGMFFDLDNFKKVNDKYGHLVGDKVLKMYAECLKEISDKYTGVEPYRLYGDEFFVFAEQRGLDFASIFQHELELLTKTRANTDKRLLFVEASMGVSDYKKGADVDDFIKEADYSMYKTKIVKKDKQKKRL